MSNEQLTQSIELWREAAKEVEMGTYVVPEPFYTMLKEAGFEMSKFFVAKNHPPSGLPKDERDRKYTIEEIKYANGDVNRLINMDKILILEGHLNRISEIWRPEIATFMCWCGGSSYYGFPMYRDYMPEDLIEKYKSNVEKRLNELRGT